LIRRPAICSSRRAFRAAAAWCRPVSMLSCSVRTIGTDGSSARVPDAVPAQAKAIPIRKMNLFMV
jgi:hypothetical protein